MATAYHALRPQGDGQAYTENEMGQQQGSFRRKGQIGREKFVAPSIDYSFTCAVVDRGTV